MKCYKVTKSDLTCYNNTQYKLDSTQTVKYTGQLCSGGVLHCYDTPEDAVFFDLIHSNYLSQGGRLWEAEYTGPSVSDGTKRGVGNLTLVKEIPIPQMLTEQRVERGIRAVLTVCKDPRFVNWAERWLEGADRSRESAEEVWSVKAAWAAASAEDAAWAAKAWAAAAAVARAVARAAEAWAAEAAAAEAAARAATWAKAAALTV
jgi:hypothetical protein